MTDGLHKTDGVSPWAPHASLNPFTFKAEFKSVISANCNPGITECFSLQYAYVLFVILYYYLYYLLHVSGITFNI